MRFDKRVELVAEGKPTFNPETGNYDTLEPTKVTKWANVTAMSKDAQTFLFGGLKQGACTVRLQDRLDSKVDYIHMDGRNYNILSQKDLRRFTVLEASERL